MVAKKTAAKQSPAGAGAPGPAGSPGDPVPPEGAPGREPAERPAASPAAGKAPAKKAPAKKATAKKAAAKKAAAKKATASGAPAEKTAARKAPAKKAAARKSAAGGSPEPDAAAEAGGGEPGGKKSVKKAVGRKAAAKKQTGARTVAAKKTAGGVTTADDEAAVPPARTGELAVRPGEDPWTPEEVAEARSELQAEVLRLRSELVHSQEELTGLMRDSGDGAGHDEADTGTKNITREHELALAANAREMLEQSEHALERLDAGTYGLCEVCGRPIGKARMQAFPRATLCVEDKQKQERRG
ncbi:TraR/DksA family transcriptional regulator [Streptomyces sp. NPDC055011]